MQFVMEVGARGPPGLLAPARTPKAVKDKLSREVARILTLPDVKEKLNSLGLIVVTESPEYFAQTIRSDYEKYGKLIRDIGLHAQ